MIYVACPYSHPKLSVREHRVDVAARLAGCLMRKGHIVFSPIVHGHLIVTRCKLPSDYTYWDVTCRFFMRMATSLTVIMMDGWSESEGLKDEVRIAEERDIPITYLTEEQVNELLLQAAREWLEQRAV